MTEELASLKKELRILKSEMKAEGVRRVSCFNGGLNPRERFYNSEIFRLTALIEKGKLP